MFKTFWCHFRAPRLSTCGALKRPAWPRGTSFRLWIRGRFRQQMSLLCLRHVWAILGHQEGEVKARKGTPIEGQRRETAATEENLLSPGQAHEGEITRYVGKSNGKAGAGGGKLSRGGGSTLQRPCFLFIADCIAPFLSYALALSLSCALALLL